MLSALLLAGLLAVLGDGPAFAEQWQIQPTANLVLGYDDNVQLATVNAKGAFSSNLNAALRAVRSTEVSDVGFALGVAGIRYFGLTGLDNHSGYAALDLGYRLEGNRFHLATRFISQSTMTSEAATTGLVQVNRQQNQWTVSPGWTYVLSERAILDLAASFQDVSYIDVGALPLYNYRVGTVGLGGTYRWTERLGLTARVNYGRYQTQVITKEYNNFGAQVGVDYQLSETTYVAALVGERRTKQTLAGLDGLSLTSDTSGSIYALKFSKRFEAGGSLGVEARRELAPSGSAQMLDTTGLSVNLHVPVRPRWQFSFNATAYRNRNLGGGTGTSDVDTASLVPRIAYELDQDWRLSLGYQLRWQKHDQISGDVLSNAIFLTLNWARPWNP